MIGSLTPGQFCEETTDGSLAFQTFLCDILWRRLRRLFAPNTEPGVARCNTNDRTLEVTSVGRKMGGGVPVFGLAGLTGGEYATREWGDNKGRRLDETSASL